MDTTLAQSGRNPVYRRRLLVHRLGIFFSSLAMAVAVGFLKWILFTLLIKGFSAINLAMFTQSTPAPGSDGGGLLNAIVGSLMMVGSAALISTPIGILAVSIWPNMVTRAGLVL